VRQQHLSPHQLCLKKDLCEADADFVAERLTGIRPRDATEMIRIIDEARNIHRSSDYALRKKDWKGATK
jgi:hypothetical protein